MEALWAEATERLKTNPKEHPVVCAIPSWTTPKQQARYMELLFETLECPAAYLSRGAPLAAFAAGRASALVIDCGAAATSAVPVVDGYALLRAVKRSKIGGFYLDTELGTKLPAVYPRQIARRVRFLGLQGDAAGARLACDTAQLALRAPDLKAFCDRDIFRSLKEAACVLPPVVGGIHKPDGIPKRPTVMELPDGSTVDFQEFRHLPERLFLIENGDDSAADEVKPPQTASTATEKKEDDMNSPNNKSQQKAATPPSSETKDPPAAAASPGEASTDEPEKRPDTRTSYYGSPALTSIGDVFAQPVVQAIPPLVRGALERCDVDIRKDLLQNVVIAGGGSLFPGLPDRLHRDLADHLAPTRLKTKVIAPSPIERQFAVWIGASILASLGSFQQLWLSKAEWDEDGPLGSFERWN